MTDPPFTTLSTGTRFPEALPTAVRWSHALLGPRLRPGDVVVDATMGNGHDTLFLARQVLPEGRVFAFDVQAGALEQTRRRLVSLQDSAPFEATVGSSASVSLIHAGHEKLEDHLPAELRGHVRAFMFNLGWLPGADNKSTFTQTPTTLAALVLALAWLQEGGLITVVCYPGHEGGDTEAAAVEIWAASLPANSFEVQKLAFLNLTGAPPRCLVIRKRKRLSDSPRG